MNTNFQPLPPLTDWERYNALQEMMLLISRVQGVAGIDSKGYQLLWAESEAIKNRHGGMPPSKETHA